MGLLSITNRQLLLLHVLSKKEGKNTRQIAQSVRAWNQAYESHLLDRLYNLQPLVTFSEKTGKHGVTERTWRLTDKGCQIVATTQAPKCDSNRKGNEAKTAGGSGRPRRFSRRRENS